MKKTVMMILTAAALAAASAPLNASAAAKSVDVHVTVRLTAEELTGTPSFDQTVSVSDLTGDSNMPMQAYTLILQILSQLEKISKDYDASKGN